MRLEGRDIVCLGTADWETELPINQHQLMRRLAPRNRVLFVESLGLRRPQLAGRDLGRIWRRLRKGLRPPRAVDGLHVLSPLVLPFHGSSVVRALNRRLLRHQLRTAVRRLGMRRPLLWAYAPQAEALLEVLEPETVVYHCVDDVAAQKGVDAESFRAVERRFAGRADLVLTSAPALAERMRSLAADVLYAPNVADTALFATALQPGPLDPALERLPAPRLVFQGAVVATKLDLDLLAETAAARPEWSIVMVGPRGAGDPGADLSALDRAPNVHLLGPREERELPAVLRGADAGLIPYAINDLTRSVFPMKVYEYLAAGLPVLSTPLPALDGIEGVEIVADAVQLVAAAEAAIAADAPERRAARSRAAASHSWEARIEQIEQALDGPDRRAVD
ncbi:MAG TPA: glycosyltransferase [Solirubrobacterales bacterium]|nr:glycosyltransferase [Solirubrobacterales bacterium]